MGYVMEYYKSPIIAKTTVIYLRLFLTWIAFNLPLYIAVDTTKIHNKNPNGPWKCMSFYKSSKKLVNQQYGVGAYA